MAAKKVKATRQSLSQVRDKALGTRQSPKDKKESFVKALKREVLEGKNPPVSREARVLARAGIINNSSFNYENNATVKKVDSDAYRLLSKLAKGKGLKGVEAETAIQKAFKAVARTVGTERKRTLTRAEGITKRQSNKRKNTNLLP